MSAALPLPLQLIWLVPVYGFSGMLLSLPWATGWIKRNGPRPAAYLNLLVTLLAVLHGSLVIREVASIGPQHLDFPWFQAADLNLRIGFDLSLTNLAALELVTTMSLVCQVFALGYLDKEWSLARFYALVGFFEGAMSGVVLSSNLFMSYFLLEMLTLSTYLLVGFWYAQPLVVTAARDAFLTKRVGDVLLLMGVVALSAWAGSMEFTDLYAWAAQAKAEQLISPLAGTLLGLGLIAGPMGKCAQFPMHLWLDEAMEGPNPASILRNSVVVTCGAIVLLKLMPVVALSPLATTVLLAVGAISAIGGGLVAVAQVDLKRAFSYSTTSYLGLVFIAIALQMPGLALLLLFAHGLARALQFMSVGSIIATTNCQDLTELGGLGTRMPATSLAFLVGSAGLVGLLPLGCFWCFGLMVDNLRQLAPGYALLFLLTNGLAAANVTRVYRSVFLGPVLPKTKRTPEANWLMALPMVSLTVIVVLLPWIMQRIDPVPGIAAFPVPVGLAVAGSGLVGVLIGAVVHLDQFWSRSTQPILRVLQDLLAYDFYTPEIYKRTIVTPVASLARLTRWFDITVVKGLVDGVGRLSLTTAEGLKLSVSGQLQSYVLTLIVAIVLLLGGLQVLRGWAEPMLLSLLLLIPFLGTLTLLLWPGSPSPSRLRLITIAILVLQLGVSLAVAWAFDPALPGMQLQEHHAWVPGIGLDYALGIDGLSLPLVLINSGLTLVSAVITRDLDKRPRIYFAMLLLITGAVNGAFLSENLLLFFLFYELELIPLWLLVSVWGGVNRAYAATKFLIFTAVSGMLILGAFLGLALLTGSVDFSLTPVLSERLAMGGQLWLLGALLIGFGIKIPLVPLHNWLPDTHTQASTPVSVLLAGVLLKLGTYGMLRFGLQLFPEAWAKLAPALAIWAAISVLYGSLAAIAQTDMKRMVAYSSVGHMGYVLLAAAADTPVSLLGAVFQMVSHGLISALLFLLVGIVYRKTGTRDLEVLRGLLNPEKGLPFTGSLMIVAVMASAGLPGMAGFISEFLVFRGSINVFPLATLLSMVGSGLTAVYFLLLVNRAFFGRLAITPPSGDAVEDARLDVQLAPVASRETIPAIALAAGVVLLGVVPSSLGRISEVATTALAAITAMPPGVS